MAEITPASGNTLASLREEVQREIHRSRRYERPFTLIRFAPAFDGAALPGDLSRLLRLVDRTWTIGRDAWALLPESGEDEVISLFKRLHRDAPFLLNCPAGIAMYPEQATTLDDLLALASSRIDIVVVDRVPPRTELAVPHAKAA